VFITFQTPLRSGWTPSGPRFAFHAVAVDESALDIVEDPSIGIVWHAPSAVANASTDTSLFMTPPRSPNHLSTTSVTGLRRRLRKLLRAGSFEDIASG
jgi:hypothetical protein